MSNKFNIYINAPCDSITSRLPRMSGGFHPANCFAFRRAPMYVWSVVDACASARAVCLCFFKQG